MARSPPPPPKSRDTFSPPLCEFPMTPHCPQQSSTVKRHFIEVVHIGSSVILAKPCTTSCNVKCAVNSGG